jgi:hypothetical protein
MQEVRRGLKQGWWVRTSSVLSYKALITEHDQERRNLQLKLELLDDVTVTVDSKEWV